MIYIPPGNTEAIVHYEETIRQKVMAESIYRHVDAGLRSRLSRIFGPRPIAVWGSRDSSANRAKFERMVPGDDILIIEGATIKLLGKVAAVTVNPELSKELWKNLRPGESDSWSLIYFIANPQEIDIPFVEFCRLIGYASEYQLRGLTLVSQEKLAEFYDRYDDLYSVLMLRKRQEPIYELSKGESLDRQAIGEGSRPPLFPRHEDIDADMPPEAVSDHVRMQWKLANLGVKASSRVWVPPSDQAKIRRAYEFNEFEPDFAAGLDTQVKYVENIDVVWKEEFRIDAAFEIENTTSIYSGLLRFADLTLVAPNTTYPLFIVAPQDKKARLIEQLRRPAFRKFQLERKVRYLSYEAVDEVDRFFERSTKGLSVDVITGRSESIPL
ncbi:MAG: hypothetical protein U0231_13145 [Nitrospiraceae bacterium]